MSQSNIIETFVNNKMVEIGLSRGGLGQRLGKNTNKALRRLEQLMKRADTSNIHLIGEVAKALEVPVEELMEVINVQRQADEDQAEAAYRAAFKPHAIWKTALDRPSSITIAALVNAPVRLYFPFSKDISSENYVRVCMDNAPRVIPCFGGVIGFTINYEPTKAVVYNLDGTIFEILDQAQRLPIARLRV